jgi:predicted CopG family antitoxin
MNKSQPSNPFHPEAVATYGQVIKTCENLGYMQTALEELNQYLISYPAATARRYGAAIGLRGGHGSGKTHLLMWLAEKARNLSSIQPIVLYAKADRASFADLYTQLVSNLSREKLQELLGEAVRKLAKEEVGKAKVSEILDEQISSNADLEILNREQKIDLDQLKIQLQAKLDTAREAVPGVTPEKPVPGTIPRMLTLLQDPNLGPKAYEWLLGKEVTDLADLNLSHPLFELKTERQDSSQQVKKEPGSAGPPPAGSAQQSEVPESSVPDLTAIDALETLAALLLIAERPLIILIDQFEILLRADDKRRQTLFSVVKKLVEQLNFQKAMTFIAGSSEPWDALTLDVTPRLRRRDPLIVGSLSLKETEHLLEAYTDSLDSKFSDSALATIRALSGGNAREVIRIAYYAYNEVNGDLPRVDEGVLIRSAGESRTVEERNKLALETIDSVLAEFGGAIRANIIIDDDISLDRILVSNDQPRLALMTMKATDKLSEINSARRFSVIRNYLETKWPNVPLMSISVGYSSSEVGNLIGTTSTVLQFDEKNFPGQLRARITELLAQPRHEAPSAATDSAVLDFLKTIAERLNTLEVERSDEMKKIADRFAEKAQVESQSARNEREIDNRWDMVNALDSLQEALHSDGPEVERGIMRSLLVANEANVKIKQIDYLGGLYLDLVAETPPPWEYSEEAEFARHKLGEAREAIIREFRRLLRGKRIIDNIVEQPLKYSLGISLILILAEITFVSTNVRYFLDYPLPYLFFRILPWLLITVAGVMGATFALRSFRLSKWERHARRLRRERQKIRRETVDAPAA